MATEASLVLIILVASLVVFILALSVVVFTTLYNRRLVQKDNEIKLSIKNHQLEVLRTVIETQSSEREKIAMNLHDEVGPLLSTMKLRIFQNQRDFSENKITDDTFKADREFLDNIIRIVRSVSHDLSPRFVIKFGLVRAMENFMKDLHTITATYETTIDEEEHPLPSHLIGNLYNIITELINNLLKHEQITTLEIFIDRVGDDLIIRMNHDGIGITNQEFDTFEQNSKGLGLTSMKSRTIVIGGELKFFKAPHSPKIEIITPIPAQ